MSSDARILSICAATDGIHVKGLATREPTHDGGADTIGNIVSTSSDQTEVHRHLENRNTLRPEARGSDGPDAAPLVVLEARAACCREISRREMRKVADRHADAARITAAAERRAGAA